MPKIKGVLLDIDGTLVDTNDAHTQSWLTVFKEHGYEVPFEKVRPLIGMGADQLLPRVVGVEKDTDEGKALSDAWSKEFKANYLDTAQAFPQAGDLLVALHTHGIRLMTASSGEQDITDVLLEKVGAKDLLLGETSSEDGSKSKPAPDIVKAALKKIGLPPEEVILVGDTPYDIEACRPLGIAVVALRSGGFSDADLNGAIALYDDPADLLAHLETSPFLQ